MSKKMSKAGALILISCFCLTACRAEGVDIDTKGMVKVASNNVEKKVLYSDESIREEVLASYVSDDGLCSIKKYPSYYDVILDYEKGSPAEVGKAYADTIVKAVPDYSAFLEPYLYENVRTLFDGRDINYQALEKRILTLKDSVPQEYKEEIESFALAVSDGEEGFKENGKLSYIEAIMMHMIPDSLRPTACSALSLSGSKTKSGKRISMRNLEWNTGSESQITTIHSVTHMKKGDRSITSISFLGILDIITAVNDDGVMIGILDVGSVNKEPYISEGKKCYTFEVRKALEEFKSARKAGEYLVAESGDFSYCHNLLITDPQEAFCAENASSEVASTGKAKSVLRDERTELIGALSWDSPDSLCIVNSFASKGNQDGFSGEPGNIVRFCKYNSWVSEKDKFSVADVKGIMAHEVVDQYENINVHNSGTVHTVIVDYESGKIHVSFTHGIAEDIPEFTDIGEY